MLTFIGVGARVLSPNFWIARNKQSSSPSSLKGNYLNKYEPGFPRDKTTDNWESWGTKKVNYESSVAVVSFAAVFHATILHYQNFASIRKFASRGKLKYHSYLKPWIDLQNPFDEINFDTAYSRSRLKNYLRGILHARKKIENFCFCSEV